MLEAIRIALPFSEFSQKIHICPIIELEFPHFRSTKTPLEQSFKHV